MQNLNSILSSYSSDRIFILTDTESNQYCLPVFRQVMAEVCPLVRLGDNVIVLPSGEQNKTLSGVEMVWDYLIEHGATRRSILINLGGGVVTDLGGFAASTFKRGIPFINIPTTLLAMIDASIGCKTGVDYRGLKNEIGLFREAARTVLYLPFLKTLPAEHFLSGYAEMIKHALISDHSELKRLIASIDTLDWHTDEGLMMLEPLIRRSMDIKNYLVEQDPDEQGLRKALNFGHTIGHAIEAHRLQKVETALQHGFAVMYGMVAELYLSHLVYGLDKETITLLSHVMVEHYGKVPFSCKDFDQLIALMHHDKKNLSSDNICFTLLRKEGNPAINAKASDEQIREALEYLFTL